jgi:protein-S-isoprenylcysteine O-methyltransferase Ste14
MGPSKRLFLISIATAIFFLAVLLVSAGYFSYWPGWIYAAISLIMACATHMILLDNPDLARERSQPGAGTKAWDKKLLGTGLVLNLATFIIAGLDSGRYHWSPKLSWIWFIPGLALNLTGMFIFLRALRENRFFSAVVRIQNDRHQTVCRTGPYGVIRHPGNAGMIVGTIGLPLLLISFWCAIPVLLSVVTLVIRTHLEDNMLEKELDGYPEYQQATRFRLIPGIW